MNREKATHYVYSVTLDRSHVAKETLIYYPSQQPAAISERNTENNVSVIRFGQKIKILQAVKEEITLKCLHNMSVSAAYMQVNTHIAEMETVLQYLTNQLMPAIVSTSSLNRYAEESIKEESAKDYILRYLQEADFNIFNITPKVQETKKGLANYTMYQHRVSSERKIRIITNFLSCLSQTVLFAHLVWPLKCKRFSREMLFLQSMR